MEFRRRLKSDAFRVKEVSKEKEKSIVTNWSDHSGVFVGDVEAEAPKKISNDFGKYINFRSLTTGGKAELRVCKDTNLGRKVVIKSLRPEFKNDSQELKRLLREARITSQLQHPGTVPVYEIGTDFDGNYYFTMKKVEGLTLFQIIVRLSQKDEYATKEYQLDGLLNVLLQVADTLAYAHARGVIHRDIKPENVLIGPFGEAVLLDWGVAKVWGMPNESSEDTIHDRGGTPLYMSPEQVLGNRMIDERTDIFSIGIVLYEMLALREPFRGANVRATFDNIVNVVPKPPSERNPNRIIPAELERICLKALQKNPADRYQSIKQMSDEIRDFRNQAMQAMG